MTAELVRPPLLRSFLEAGCDVTIIPDLEQCARVIVIGQVMPWQLHAKLALSFDETAEAWLAGEEARPIPGEEIEPTPERLRHYLWLAEGLMEPEVAQMFEAALLDNVRAVCWERIRELDAETTAELDEAASLDQELPGELERGDHAPGSPGA